MTCPYCKNTYLVSDGVTYVDHCPHEAFKCWKCRRQVVGAQLGPATVAQVRTLSAQQDKDEARRAASRPLPEPADRPKPEPSGPKTVEELQAEISRLQEQIRLMAGRKPAVARSPVPKDTLEARRTLARMKDGSLPVTPDALAHALVRAVR